MFRNNANIIGFLQKKAFFTKSPSPSPVHNSRFKTNPAEDSTKYITPPKPNRNDMSSKYNTNYQNKNIFNLEVQETKRINGYTSTVGLPKTEKATEEKPRNTHKSFQASRVEVKMCMQQLSSRVSVQLRMLQGAVTQLTVSLESIFYKKLHELKQELLKTIDSMFAQARNNLNNLISNNNEQHLKKLLKSRFTLTEADKKIKQLKSKMEINWKKVAGQFFAQEYDQKLQKLLAESEQLRNNITHKQKQADVTQRSQQILQLINKNVLKLIQIKCS